MGLALWSTQGHPQGVPLRGVGRAHCLKQDLMDCDGFSGWGWRCGVHKGTHKGCPYGGWRGRLSEAGFAGL